MANPPRLSGATAIPPNANNTPIAQSPIAIQAFFDHPNPANPVTFTTAIPNSGDPSRSCPGVPQDKVYNAQTNPSTIVLNEERVRDWLSRGAQPTATVSKLLRIQGVS